jgi:hypothetical protein
MTFFRCMCPEMIAVLHSIMRGIRWLTNLSPPFLLVNRQERAFLLTKRSLIQLLRSELWYDTFKSEYWFIDKGKKKEFVGLTFGFFNIFSPSSFCLTGQEEATEQKGDSKKGGRYYLNKFSYELSGSP